MALLQDPFVRFATEPMRILRELAAMDMPDGLTVEGPRAPDGSGELVRARVAPSRYRSGAGRSTNRATLPPEN